VCASRFGLLGCRSFWRSSTRSIEVYTSLLIRIMIFATADFNFVIFSIFMLIFSHYIIV